MIYIVAALEHPQSIRALTAALGLGRNTVAKYCKELERLGWMRITGEGDRRCPTAIIPNPVEAMLATESLQLIDTAHFKGEETMKQFLEWITAPHVRFIYNCRPDFLTSPETGQPLEYDVFAEKYLWAIEYFGDQHFGLTTLYSDTKELRETQKRDLVKVGLSQKNNIRLSVVTKNDLSLEKLLPMVPSDVPKRIFDPKGPFVQALERVGKACATGQQWDRR